MGLCVLYRDKSKDPEIVKDYVVKKDKKAKKKHSKSIYDGIEENVGIDSPSQIPNEPFKRASRFFEPNSDIINISLPPLPPAAAAALEQRRPRSNTSMDPVASIEGMYVCSNPVGKTAEKTVCRTVFLTIRHSILSAELIKMHSFRLFSFWRFCPLGR